jgi:polygalacturonase
MTNKRKLDTITVKQFGAAGDGFHLDTAAIQKAIDYSSSHGVEAVIEPGLYLISTLVIKSHAVIRIDKGAVLLGSDNLSDYKSDIRLFVDAVNQERGRCLIYGEEAENVKIYGEGTINGRGGAFHDAHPEQGKRPFLCRFVDCKNVVLDGVEIKNSAAWCLHLLDCEDVELTNLTISSRINHNNDGIDIDSCRRVLVEHCDIDTGDDGICLKATIRKVCSDIVVRSCMITSRWAAFKIGTESYGDFQNILFENCTIYDTEGCGIKIVPVDGASVENVTIRNITMMNTTGPIFIAVGERLRTYFEGDEPREAGVIRHVHISNIKADVVDAEGFAWDPGPHSGFVTNDGIWGNGKGGVVISGLPTSKLQNITLEQLNLTLPGGVQEYHKSASDVIEMGANYPEFHVFGVLPSYGLFLRHIEGLQLNHINIQLKNEDCREEMVCVDVSEKTKSD